MTQTIKESGGDWSTIAGWLADHEDDLVSANEIQVGELYKRASTDWVESNLSVSLATVDATHYRQLTVVEADRHDGTEGSGTIIDPTASEHVFVVDEDEFHVDHIAIRDWVGSSSEAFRVNNTNFRLSYSMIYESGSTDQDGVYFGANSIEAFIHNCFFFSITRSAILAQIIQNADVYISNCTGTDLVSSATAAYPGFGFDNQGSRNNTGSTFWCQNVSSACIQASRDAFHGGGKTGQEGTVDATTCASDDISLSTGDNVTTDGFEVESVVQADQFVYLTPTSVDLHLKAGNDLEEVGTDLSADANLPFSDDIDGTARTDPWDIGGHEFSADGVPLAPTRMLLTGVGV